MKTEGPVQIHSRRVAVVNALVHADSSQSEADSRHLAGDSPQSSTRLVADSHHWPPELLSLAEPSRRKTKLPAAEMQTVVASLCHSRWLTANELATLLRRDTEILQGRILAGLIKTRRG